MKPREFLRPRAFSNFLPLALTNGFVWLWGWPGAMPKCRTDSRAFLGPRRRICRREESSYCNRVMGRRLAKALSERRASYTRSFLWACRKTLLTRRTKSETAPQMLEHNDEVYKKLCCTWSFLCSKAVPRHWKQNQTLSTSVTVCDHQSLSSRV